jgi:isopentenyldiphosphate isomerase
MSLLDRIAECNAHDPAAYRALTCAGHAIGAVRHRLAERLRDFPNVFAVSESAVHLSDAFKDADQRSQAVERVVRVLEADGIVRGRRDEAYPVLVNWGEAPLLRIERAAAPHFGIRSYGVHMTGYVRTPDGPLIWVARRARNKPTYPGMLDNTVAGGQPVGLGLHDNMVKECWEEAGIPEELARKAVCTGAITYRMDAEDGLKPDVQFCFDLELPADFVPRNTDGEIDEFYAWPWRKAAEVVSETREFKFNCNLVLIDFFVRHGLVDPGRADYLDIVAGLRR